VGGKTAINLPQQGSQGDGRTLIKNLVGTFHQPSIVLSDVNALASLPRNVVSDGLAECIKHACLCDHATQAKGNNQLARTMKLVAPVLAGSPAARAKLIASNVGIKAAIAGPDVTERAPDKTGGRALLNFGHTFAHVLEGLSAHNGGGGGQRVRSRKVHVDSNRASRSHVLPVSHVSHVSHGQAVALGMVAAAHAGLALKTCTPGLVAMLLDAIDAAELPTHVPSHVLLPPADELIRRMVATDKKVLAGTLRIIVPVGSVPGRCAVVASPNEAALRAAWES
jgi:3-dehydroquinate synthetase